MRSGWRWILVWLLVHASAVSAQDALYVWRDPVRGGTPIACPSLADCGAAEVLRDFAASRGLAVIYYDNFGDGSSDGGSGRQGTATLGRILETLHGAGLEVRALYTDRTRIADVLTHNSQVTPARRFDGVHLNFEGPWPGGGGEPTQHADLQYFRDALTAAAPLPVSGSISHHWDEPIVFSGTLRPAYQHLIGLLDHVDVQTATDSAAGIEDRVEEEVTYGGEVGKPVKITIETFDVRRLGSAGLDWSNSFCDEGEQAMLAALAALDLPAPASFAFHFYRASYGLPTAWPCLFADGFERGDTTAWSARVP